MNLKELLQKLGFGKSDEEREEAHKKKVLKELQKEFDKYDNNTNLESAGVGLNLELQKQMKQKEKPNIPEKQSIFKSIFNFWKRTITHIFPSHKFLYTSATTGING